MSIPVRSIIHLDMDAFFASVEILDDPSLRGQPVIVGGGQRGVVSAASYEARKYGVHSALPVAIARQRCPDGVFIQPRLGRYRQVSDDIMSLFSRFTPLVEPLSLDEAFLDVTGCKLIFGEACFLAERIRALVRDEIGLTVSAGVGSSKLIAKIASDRNKPDGLTVVTPGCEVQFLTPLPVETLPGVGAAVRRQLTLLGVQTIGDLAKVPEGVLVSKLGRAGSLLHLSSRGIDHRPVEPEREIKSLGHEETFAADLLDRAVIRRQLLALSIQVASRLRRHGLMARTVVLKVKYHDFVQITRSRSVAATDDGGTIYRTGCQLLEQTLAGRKPLRLVGITAANLLAADSARQGSLFEHVTRGEERRWQVNQAMDAINAAYGQRAIQPAALLDEGDS